MYLMALDYCEECSGKLSNKAPICPHCGCPNLNYEKTRLASSNIGSSDAPKSKNKLSTKNRFSKLEKFCIFLIIASIITVCDIIFEFSVWIFLFQVAGFALFIFLLFLFARMLTFLFGGSGKSSSNNTYRRVSVFQREQHRQSISDVADEVDDFDGGF